MPIGKLYREIDITASVILAAYLWRGGSQCTWKIFLFCL